MKILVFFIFFVSNLITYSDYLLTNSEIVTFYDTDRNEIRDIKGNLFQDIDISKIDILLKDNGNNIYHLKNYIQNIEKLKNTNILKINYKIKDKRIEMKLIPSISDKANFYIAFKILKGNLENSSIIFKLITQKNRKLVKINNDDGSLRYDNFFIRTSLNPKNYSLNFIDAENNEIINLRDSQVDKIKIKKYNIVYFLKNLENTKNFFFKIRFEKNDKKSIEEDFKAIEKEENYWKKNKIEIKDKKIEKILENLYILTQNRLIPNKIAFEISEEKSEEKAKLIYIQERLGFSVNINDILKEIILQKSNLENIELYNILFETLDISFLSINEKLFKHIIKPQVLTIIDMIDENGEVVAEEDNIGIYYKLYKLISLLDNRRGFEQENKWLLGTKAKLKDYINKFYFKDDKIKTRKNIEKYNIKDIQYIEVFDIENKKDYLKQFFCNNFSKKYNLFLSNQNYIDINFNLKMIDLFYKYGLRIEAEKLLKGIDEIVENTQGYIVPKFNIYSKNNIGIYGNTIYLYLKMYKNREKNLEKK